MAKTVIEPPRRVAQAFADYLNSVLNRTVTDARLTLLPIPGAGHETQFNLTCVENGESVAFALHGVSQRLFIRQAIEVVGEHCQTVSYAYRYQADEGRKSWLLRWEYFRERPRADWHLITEWGVAAKSDDWRDFLNESLEGFERRRRAP